MTEGQAGEGVGASVGAPPRGGERPRAGRGRAPPLFRTGDIETGRLEAFSDGVIAIVITLLVLDVKAPLGLKTEAELWRALAHVAPVLAAWVVSFFFALVFWVNHHYFIAGLRNADRGLLWLNGLFLLCISATPFPIGLVAAYPEMTAPYALLALSMCLTSLAFALMRWYAVHRAGLSRVRLTEAEKSRAMAQSASAPAIYILAAGLAFLWRPGTLALLGLVPLLFFLRSPARHAPGGPD